MNDDMNDTIIADLFADDPTPGHGPEFWDRIEADLDAATTEAAGSTINVIELHPFGESTVDDAEPPSRRRWPLIMTAAALVAAVGLAALFVTTRTKDDSSTAVATQTEGQGAVFNPLIAMADLQRHQASTPVFTVQTAAANDDQYWSTATLNRFDGTSWWSESEFRPLPGGEVPMAAEGMGEEGLTEEGMASKTFTLVGDVPALLPHPDHWVWVTSAVPLSANDQFDLAVSGEARDVELPLSYTTLQDPSSVYLATPPIDISGIGPDGPDISAFFPDAERREEWLNELRTLPDDFPAEVRDLALALTSGLETDREKAAAVENFFRADFTNSLEFVEPPSNEAMVAFLERRSGSSDMFASTYAAMMRAAGVPARIKVGFSGGIPDPADPNFVTVTGDHAHAWPEVIIDSGPSSIWMRFEPTPGRGEATKAVQPFPNRDHWHAVYGVYDCTTGSYLPHFTSEVDEVGIHSHQDGLIHIHPWFESSAGENAQLGLFFDSMGIEVDESGIALGNGERLDAGVTCDGKPAVVHVRKFQSENSPATVIDGDPNRVRFENDREGYIIAVAPLDADIPPLPAERVQMLDSVAGAIEFEPDTGG